MNRNDAFKFGVDCGRNGANTQNCSFRIFSSVENTRSWEKGRDLGLRSKRVKTVKKTRAKSD